MVQATLHNTASKVKFRDKLSESFTIETGVRQRDGISRILFNCVLEKTNREWIRSLPENIGLRMGVKADNLRSLCLDFADDLKFLANDMEETACDSRTANAVLLINIGKTEFITNVKDAPLPK